MAAAEAGDENGSARRSSLSLTDKATGVAWHVQILSATSRLVDWPGVAKAAAQHPRVLTTIRIGLRQ